MSKNVIISSEDIKKALEMSGGMMTHAASLLDCHYSTISYRCKAEPELMDVVRSSRERHIDDAETSLRELVKDKDLGATIFSLKTIGKSRGYIENLQGELAEMKSAMEEFRRLNAHLYPKALEGSEIDTSNAKDHSDSTPEPCNPGSSIPDLQ